MAIEFPVYGFRFTVSRSYTVPMLELAIAYYCLSSASAIINALSANACLLLIAYCLLSSGAAIINALSASACLLPICQLPIRSPTTTLTPIDCSSCQHPPCVGWDQFPQFSNPVVFVLFLLYKSDESTSTPGS